MTEVSRARGVSRVDDHGSTASRRRSLPVIAAALGGLTLIGCGPVAARTAHPAAPSAPAAQGANPTTGNGASTPSPTPSAATTPSPASAPASPAPLLAVATTNPAAVVISLVDLNGATVASTSLSSSALGGMVAAGPQGAYWIAGGTLHRLDRSGTVHDFGAIPAGSFTVAPDGDVAYAVSTQVTPQGVMDNQLFLLRDGHSQLLAERRADPAHPSADAPDMWGYAPRGWTANGVVIVRVPYGGCGCGPFGMDTVNGHSGIVDLQSGVAASLTNDDSCPLSGIAADGTAACFHTPAIPSSKNAGRGADELRVIRGGHVVQSFALSTLNAGGQAVFSADAQQLAYATVAAGSDCGGWLSHTQLHLLDLQRGTARALAQPGLQPAAWLADGRLIATRWITAADGSLTSQLLVVDPRAATSRVVVGSQPATTTMVGVVSA